MHSPRNIAAAVNGHLKALRLLGRKETTLVDTANALGLTEAEVILAFQDFKIAGAKINDIRQRSHVMTKTHFSRVIDLGR